MARELHVCLGCGRDTEHPSQICRECGSPIVKVECRRCGELVIREELREFGCAACCPYEEDLCDE